MNGARSQDSLGLKVVRHAKSLGAIFAAIAAAIGLVLVVGGESIEPYTWIILTLGVHWVVLLHLAHRLLEHECPMYYGSPRVRSALRGDRLLIVERSPWLGYGVATSVYVSQADLERLVCTGWVVNVQQNDLVQIEIDSGGTGMQDEDDLWQVLEHQRESLIIRPGLDRRSLSE